MPDPSVAKALDEARKLVAALESYTPSPANHLALLSQATAVRTSLEEPFDVITRMTENISHATATHTLVKIKALQALPADGTSISADDLAALTNTDKTVIQRCFRTAVVFGTATEPEPDRFAHNAMSRAFQPEVLGCFLMVVMEFAQAWVHLPAYLAEHQPADIFDLRKSPAVFSQGKEHLGKTYYEVLDDNPEYRAIWNAIMGAIEKNMPILGMFPFASLKQQVEADPSRPFLVDIGGGRGQATLAILGEVGGSFGADAVLQDLPVVIDALDPADLPGVTLMRYDAGTPQPVRNAHVYFMRRLLHDFYSGPCIEFVRNTAAAMGPDSRLLICDMLVPDRTEVGVSTEIYWLDFALMCMSGKEKTLGEFREILDAAGLEMVEVHRSDVGGTVIVEARLKR